MGHRRRPSTRARAHARGVGLADRPTPASPAPPTPPGALVAPTTVPDYVGTQGMGGYVPHPYEPPPIVPADIAAQGRVERGASGTTNFYGYITGEEYNPKLAGLAAMPVYAEMRNDSQVQASLLLCKQPLVGANWAAMPPEDGDDQDVVIAEFCHDCLFGEGAMADPWSFVLAHLLLRLDFGFSLLEIIYRVADDRTIRIERLAPRLPRTVQRFEVDSNGRLVTAVQLAYKDLAYQYLPIPAQYALITVHQREGDNYYGRALLRSCYENWFRKKQAYNIDAVRLDRYGVGVPYAEIQDTPVQVTEDELKAIDKTLRGLRSFEKGYIRSTAKVKYSILTPSGSGTGGADAMPSIKHHNEQILVNILGTFMTEGGVGGGVGSNRTQTLASVYFAALESLASEIANDLQQQVIRRLCDLNFNMKGRRYPVIKVTGVADMDLNELGSNLEKLGAKGFVTPDDTIEDVLRKMMHLPPLAEDQRGRDRTPKPPIVIGAPGPVPDPEDGPGQPTKPTTKKAANKKPEEGNSDSTTIKKTSALRAGAGAIACRQSYTDPATGMVYGREPNERESGILALREIPQFLDQQVAFLTDTITKIRQAQLETLAARIAKKDARPTADFTDIRPANFAMPQKGDLEKAIKQTQAIVAQFGSTQVRNELTRQGAAITASLGAATNGAPWLLCYDEMRDGVLRLAKKKKTTGIVAAGEDATAGAGKAAAKSLLVTSAAVTAEKLNAAWFARIMETAVRLRRSGNQGDLLASLTVDTLADEVAKGFARDVKGEVNEAFAVGRAVEASAMAGEIDVCVYSAILDQNTCSNCEDVDGTETDFGSETYIDLMPPYRECEGNRGAPDACRCVWIYLMADRQEGRQ